MWSTVQTEAMGQTPRSRERTFCRLSISTRAKSDKHKIMCIVRIVQVIQRREDGKVDFYRDWKDYKNGFGEPHFGEYWIG